jgi:hypothetical protein
MTTKKIIMIAVYVLLTTAFTHAQKEKAILVTAGYQMPAFEMKDVMNNGFGICISRITLTQKYGGSGLGIGFYTFSPKTIEIMGMTFTPEPYSVITLNFTTEGRLFGTSDNSFGLVYKVDPALGYRITENAGDAGRLDFLAHLGVGPRIKLNDKTTIRATADYNSAHVIKYLFKKEASSSTWMSVSIGVGYSL